MNKILKLAIIAIGVLLLSAAGLFFYYSNAVISSLDLVEPRELVIERGDGVREIAAKAHSLGLIGSERIFSIYVSQNGLAPKLKAGRYHFDGRSSIELVANRLIAGDKTSNTKRLTMPEGWNIKEIDAYLASQGLTEPGDFIKLAGDPATTDNLAGKFAFLSDKPAKTGLEGYLFPDTYDVFADASAMDVISKQLANFDQKLPEAWRTEISQQGKTVYQILTMASILEKEVRKAEDMKIVSGLFWQRIANGQPLQSCATLAYILGVDKPQYTIEDTKIDSPYNTYQHQGLPPGPIANPGSVAIDAAIHPAQTDFNYFLTASDTGETIFSRTYEEHLRNKAKYLR